MKKVLFASTALVMTAGMAAAQGVTLSGSAEMGMFDSTRDGVDGQFHTDIDVTFTMAGETDGGLTFGATIDLDESDGSNVGESSDSIRVDPGPDGVTGTDDDEQIFSVPGSSGASPAFTADSQGGETIFISGGFGTVTMGDTDGAYDWALTEVLFSNGSLADNEETLGYTGNAGLDGFYDGQILRYDYTFGDFGVALSGEIDDSDDDGDPVLGIGFKYSADFAGNAVSFGLGYQWVDGAGALFSDQIGELTDDSLDGLGFAFDGEADVIGVSVSTTVGEGFSAGINYSTYDLGDVDADHIGVGVGYSAGALLASANYGIFDFDNAGELSGLGLTVGYDLGGGAVVQAGYGYNDINGDGDDGIDDDFSTYSVGLSFSF
jgi:outer membrane protein OmpU